MPIHKQASSSATPIPWIVFPSPISSAKMITMFGGAAAELAMVIRLNTGKTHLLLASRTDAGHLGLGFGLSKQQFGSLVGVFAPQMICRTQLGLFMVEVQVNRCLGSPGKDDGIVAGAFEFGREQSYTAASSNMMACSDSGGTLFFVEDAFRQSLETIFDNKG